MNIAKELDISDSSLRRVVKEDLVLNQYKIICPQLLARKNLAVRRKTAGRNAACRRHILRLDQTKIPILSVLWSTTKKIGFTLVHQKKITGVSDHISCDRI